MSGSAGCTTVSCNNAGDWTTSSTTTTGTNFYSVPYWSPSIYTTWYPMYSEDKATVAFRVLKRLVDKGLIDKKLDLKKFLALVEEVVQCL